MHPLKKLAAYGWFDPSREEATFVRLEEEELIEILRRLSVRQRKGREDETYSISDLLNGFDIVARDQFVVCIEELDTSFLESPLSQ